MEMMVELGSRCNKKSVHQAALALFLLVTHPPCKWHWTGNKTVALVALVTHMPSKWPLWRVAEEGFPKNQKHKLSCVGRNVAAILRYRRVVFVIV